MVNNFKIWRDAKTWKFITIEEAKKSPSTSIIESINNKEIKQRLFLIKCRHIMKCLLEKK